MQGDLQDAVFAPHPDVLVFLAVAVEHVLEPLPGGACTHWKNVAFARRTPRADIGLHSGEITHSLVESCL